VKTVYVVILPLHTCPMCSSAQLLIRVLKIPTSPGYFRNFTSFFLTCGEKKQTNETQTWFITSVFS